MPNLELHLPNGTMLTITPEQMSIVLMYACIRLNVDLQTLISLALEDARKRF